MTIHGVRQNDEPPSELRTEVVDFGCALGTRPPVEHAREIVERVAHEQNDVMGLGNALSTGFLVGTLGMVS